MLVSTRTDKKLVEYPNARWNLNGIPESHCPRWVRRLPESTTSDQNRSWRSTLSIPETTILLNLGSRSPPPDARDTCLRDHRITELGTNLKPTELSVRQTL